MYYINTEETYCVSCKKNAANENPNVRRTKQNILMPLSNCTACGKKKNQGLLKTRSSIKQYSTFLIKFEMVTLK